MVTERLAEDRVLLDEKSLRSQFKKLIVDPFHLLMTRHPSTVSKPLLIVLDGLDECSCQEAQCEFIELISDLARTVKGFPLLWLICSRPEWHLKQLISMPDFPTACKREELKIDDSEAQQDVIRFLRAEFVDICRRFPNYINTPWPPEATLRLIATVASGLFALAVTVTRFIGDKIADDPCAQLEVCVQFLGGSGRPGAINPLHALDLLYSQICSIIPETVLATTKRILGLSTYYPHGAHASALSAQGLANFLRLGQTEFYRSLKQLHSVIDIPSASEAHGTRLRFYHASFPDYLKDPSRSHKFAIDEVNIHYDVAEHAIRQAKNGTEKALLWKSDDKLSRGKLLSSLSSYAAHVVWRACPSLAPIHILSITEQLEELDFRILNDSAEGLPAFIRWLYSLPYPERLVHIRTQSCQLTHSLPTRNFHCSKLELEEFEQALVALRVNMDGMHDHFTFDLGFGASGLHMVTVIVINPTRYLYTAPSLSGNDRSHLNTICARMKWSFRKGAAYSSGPRQSPTWTADLFINGRPYTGLGPSKGLAYEAAARGALDDLRLAFPDAVPDDFL